MVKILFGDDWPKFTLWWPVLTSDPLDSTQDAGARREEPAFFDHAYTRTGFMENDSLSLYK